MAKKYILCVDDEKSVLTSLKQELRAGLGEDYTYEIAESGEEGLDISVALKKKGHELPVVISDQLMPGMKGDQFLIRLHEEHPKTRKILLTGQASAVAVGNALNQANLFRFLSKPWAADDICHTVKEAMNVFYLDQQLEIQNQTLRNINRYARLLASELDLRRWAESLLTEITRDTGSTKGLLVVYSGQEAEQQRLISRAYTNGKEWQYEPLNAEDLARHAPIGLLTKAKMNQKALVVGNARKGEWEQAPYIKDSDAQSLFCAPIQKNGHALGMLYMETSQRANHYDAERLELLNSVVGQLALSLDNVLLYADLADKVKLEVGDLHSDHASMKESIAYASRIQQTLMPKVSRITERFPQAFVLYEPRDVLSGDFYWTDTLHGVTYLAAADCTGHGVPGAMLSVLGINTLYKVTARSKEVLAPGQILTELHREVIMSMPHIENSNEAVQDGMDAAVVTLNLKTGTLQYAGARRPALLLRGQELTELQPDRASVGDSDHRRNPDLAFTNHTQSVQKGDRLFLFSDGFQDQFGSASKRKFSYQRMKELLAQGGKLTMTKQGETLKNRLKLWQGDQPQTDDILILGIEIP